MKLRYVKSKYTTSDTVHYWLRKIRPDRPIQDKFYSLSTGGLLIIKKGYSWDGPSGPTIDTPDVMFCSLIHDVLYEMFRKKQLDQSWRDEADEELADIGVACGAIDLRMAIWEWAVNSFAKACADPKRRKKIYEVCAIESL